LTTIATVSDLTADSRFAPLDLLARVDEALGQWRSALANSAA